MEPPYTIKIIDNFFARIKKQKEKEEKKRESTPKPLKETKEKNIKKRKRSSPLTPCSRTRMTLAREENIHKSISI